MGESTLRDSAREAMNEGLSCIDACKKADSCEESADMLKVAVRWLAVSDALHRLADRRDA